MKKLLLIFGMALFFILAWHYGLGDRLTFPYLKAHLTEYQQNFRSNPLRTGISFFLLYAFLTALSFPGASLLTLLAGALFGFTAGTLIVSFASSIGATLAFFSSRFLFSSVIQKKFSRQLETINKNISRDGAYYLLTLRLIPVFPFWVVNLLLGLTSVDALTYYFYSQLGMLPATLIYIYAGVQFSEINSYAEILTPRIISLFFVLGIFPTIGKMITSYFRHRRIYRPYKRPVKFDYNMIVIGGGSAGLVTSFISSTVKAKVALIEKNKMGGDCLNTGCVPSKALIKTTRVLALQKKAHQLGIESIEMQFNFMDVMKRIKRIKKSVEPHDSKERYEQLGVQCLSGQAKIISPYEVQLGDKTLTTKAITIATGARPVLPAIKGMEKISVLTSENIWDLEALPVRLLIIGGGAIGCELAQCFIRMGSAVTLLEGGERILMKEDPEVSVHITEQFRSEGITILTGTNAAEFLVDDAGKYLLCENGMKIPFDEVLIAVGRRPVTKQLGLEELGIELSPGGAVVTNEYMQTNIPNIYACGDVSGHFQFTHTAAHEAWYCAVNGLFGSFKKFKVNYDLIPWCTFTDPEIAVVGLSEKQLSEKKMQYEVTRFSLSELDRAIADDATAGFIKIFTAKDSDKILGVIIAAENASMMILEFISAMKYKKGLNSILNTIHIYPTMGEANKYVAGAWKRKHVPHQLLKYTEKYFKWIRNG